MVQVQAALFCLSIYVMHQRFNYSHHKDRHYYETRRPVAGLLDEGMVSYRHTYLVFCCTSVTRHQRASCFQLETHLKIETLERKKPPRSPAVN
jgi:hypothetical protein